MTWRYQATHRTVKTASGKTEDVFEVREVYEGLTVDESPGLNVDDKLSWTEDAIAPASETKDGLVEVLQMMLKDVQEFGVLDVGE